MWSDLGDPALEAGVLDNHEPLRTVIRALRSREYRHRFFGHWSHDNFAIGKRAYYSSPYPESGEPLISIEMAPSNGLLLVGQRGAEPRWGMWKENGYWVRVGKWAYCNCEQALGLIDSIIARHEGIEGDSDSG